MTQEEIQDARDLIAKATDTPWNDGAVNIVIANMHFIAKARTLLLKAVDSLEEARLENERLEEMSLAGTDALRCPECKRVAEENVNCEHCGAKLRPWFDVNAVDLGEPTT